MPPIYLDNHATTKVDPRVLEKMLPYFCDEFGNASSQDHSFGDQAATAVEEARKEVSNLVGVSSREVYFTSGATEAVNIGIKGLALHRNRMGLKTRIAFSPIEHQAVLATCKELSLFGIAELFPIKIDSKGRVDLNQINEICKSGIDLVCMMAANNEVGNVFPLREICTIAAQYDAQVFSDASQAVGKIPMKFPDLGVPMAVFSSHKMYGPKGVGALVISRHLELDSIIHGGGQEHGVRPGSLNVPSIVGFGEACRLRSNEMTTDEISVQEHRNFLQQYFQSELKGVVVNGDMDSRLAGNLNISFPGIPNSAVISRVREMLAISTGSACSSGVESASYVLKAMGLGDEIAESALRFGVGKFNTFDEVSRAGQLVCSAVREIRKIM